MRAVSFCCFLVTYFYFFYFCKCNILLPGWTGSTALTFSFSLRLQYLGCKIPDHQMAAKSYRKCFPCFLVLQWLSGGLQFRHGSPNLLQHPKWILGLNGSFAFYLVNCKANYFFQRSWEMHSAFIKTPALPIVLHVVQITGSYVGYSVKGFCWIIEYGESWEDAH